MKNKIQIFILAITIIFGFAWLSNSYSITWDELKELNAQKLIIKNASNYNLRKYHSQFSKRYEILKTDDRLWTISKELRDYSNSIFTSRKQLEKDQNSVEKSNFVEKYKDNISIDVEIPEENCMWWYNTIDSISFANDFPTALTIAIWYKESNCYYQLPKNWNGPFQITSKNYWAWEITEEVFKQTIQDFIDFSKNKIKSYNDKSNEEFPKINITYSSYDYTWLVSFMALYNWWTRTGWMVKPNNPSYVFDWYGADYSNSKKYGVFPMFIKILELELNR